MLPQRICKFTGEFFYRCFHQLRQIEVLVSLKAQFLIGSIDVATIKLMSRPYTHPNVSRD